MIRSIHKQDVEVFHSSIICVAMVDAEIVGSVKITKWDHSLDLPIKKIFHINPAQFRETGVQNIWHIGRFAISTKAKDGAQLLRKLISIAIYPICCTPHSVMLAECDSKFVRVLNLMGIRNQILAKGITYLGSETLPIFSTQNWLLDYLYKSPYYTDALDFHDRSKAAKRLLGK